MRLTISKVNQVLYSGDVQAVNCPGAAGELTILPHHAPLVTPLKQGEIHVRASDGTHTFPVEHGVLETSNNEVIILL
jgi:F-type H+-transporting ATPase subunit epsilon